MHLELADVVYKAPVENENSAWTGILPRILGAELPPTSDFRDRGHDHE
jgi:hypothetical protein